jgi:hypothetical protein
MAFWEFPGLKSMATLLRASSLSLFYSSLHTGNPTWRATLHVKEGNWPRYSDTACRAKISVLSPSLCSSPITFFHDVVLVCAYLPRVIIGDYREDRWTAVISSTAFSVSSESLNPVSKRPEQGTFWLLRIRKGPLVILAANAYSIIVRQTVRP